MKTAFTINALSLKKFQESSSGFTRIIYTTGKKVGKRSWKEKSGSIDFYKQVLNIMSPQMNANERK